MTLCSVMKEGENGQPQWQANRGTAEASQTTTQLFKLRQDDVILFSRSFPVE